MIQIMIIIFWYVIKMSDENQKNKSSNNSRKTFKSSKQSFLNILNFDENFLSNSAGYQCYIFDKLQNKIEHGIFNANLKHSIEVTIPGRVIRKLKFPSLRKTINKNDNNFNILMSERTIKTIYDRIKEIEQITSDAHTDIDEQNSSLKRKNENEFNKNKRIKNSATQKNSERSNDSD